MTKAAQPTNIIKIASHNVIFISDIHFGVNTSSEEWQDNINNYFEKWFIPYVKRQKEITPDVVIVCLGDVFHDRKSIDIDVNNLCIDTFETLASIVPCYIINGNHDLSKKTNKGNSSLRSLSNIENVTVIKEPTAIHFIDGRKIVSKMIAIPYLGDCNDENDELTKYAANAKYALMHTDISNMKFDNGMIITGAVDAERFHGKIISGHIHKRQETAKVLYVGSPYHLSRSDIGNQKGIYKLNLDNDTFEFTENDFSPIFDKINIKKFLSMSQLQRDKMVENNYIDIIIDEKEIDEYKMSDVYDMLNNSKAKKIQINVIKSKKNAETEEGEDYKELSIEQLIEQTIDNLPDIDDDFKKTLKIKSNQYYKNAQMQLDM